MKGYEKVAIALTNVAETTQSARDVLRQKSFRHSTLAASQTPHRVMCQWVDGFYCLLIGGKSVLDSQILEYVKHKLWFASIHH